MSSSLNNICGVGGIRTLVQTRKQSAFYMLIFILFVGKERDWRHQTQSLSSLFRKGAEASPVLSPIYLHHLIGTLRSHSIRVMSCSGTCAGIKRWIYYTSITQQERNYYCQLKFCRLRLKCKPTTHCMLTNLFYPLSKPVNPIMSMNSLVHFSCSLWHKS